MPDREKAAGHCSAALFPRSSAPWSVRTGAGGLCTAADGTLNTLTSGPAAVMPRRQQHLAVGQSASAGEGLGF